MEEILGKLYYLNIDEEVEAIIRFDSMNKGYVAITSCNGQCWEAAAGNLFDSLVLIRKEMESIAIFPLCHGARINIAVSTGGRQTFATRKVYKIEIGHQAQRDNLVDIFDHAERDVVGTVQEQKEFNQKWVSSLREKMK